MLVAPWSSMAATSFAGSAFAGREASISGMRVVIPSAGLKRAKSGKVARSTSPGSMP